MVIYNKIELNTFNNITNNNIIISMNKDEIAVSVNKKKNKLSKKNLGQFYTTNQE